jgi:inhibitor of cysteine peptidase
VFVEVRGGSGDQGNEIVLRDHDNGRQVTLNVGDTLVVRLTSNPTTGFRWNLASNMASPFSPGFNFVSGMVPPLQPVGTPTFESPRDARPGAPGVQVFRYTVTGAGVGTLRLFYERPFGALSQTARKWEVTVVVPVAGVSR